MTSVRHAFPTPVFCASQPTDPTILRYFVFPQGSQFLFEGLVRLRVLWKALHDLHRRFARGDAQYFRIGWPVSAEELILRLLEPVDRGGGLVVLRETVPPFGPGFQNLLQEIELEERVRLPIGGNHGKHVAEGLFPVARIKSIEDRPHFSRDRRPAAARPAYFRSSSLTIVPFVFPSKVIIY